VQLKSEHLEGVSYFMVNLPAGELNSKESNPMAITLDHPEIDELAHELSHYTGESVTQAVLTAMRERLEREKEKLSQAVSLKEEILRIGQECAALPVLDQRTPEEILGYNQHGVPA
jgi:antitoxin VapB